MKTNLKIICAIVILAFVILWFCNREEEPKQTSIEQISSTNVPSAQNATISHAVEQQSDTNVSASVTATATPKLPQTNSVTPQEKLNALVENKNTLINFWGVVVDQDGIPLEGVEVAGDTRTWYVTKTLNFDARFPKFNTVSDSNGKFEIHEASGDVLTIKSLEKENYEPEPHALRGFGFHTSERFSSDPNSPVIFKMWKTNIHEQLIVGKKRFHIVPDGRPYFIDLSKGTITESGDGDLKVWIKYPAEVIRGQLYDWSSEIDVVNGGLLQETDDYSSMYSAPAEGYTPTFQYPQIPQQIKGGQRGSTGTKRFYIMLNNGQEYGRITIELIAPYNDQIPGLIDIQYAINPSGSRILR
jgi:hypothetical protein